MGRRQDDGERQRGGQGHPENPLEHARRQDRGVARTTLRQHPRWNRRQRGAVARPAHFQRRRSARLKVLDEDEVRSALQERLSRPRDRAVRTAVVHDQPAVDVQPRAIVRRRGKAVRARARDGQIPAPARAEGFRRSVLPPVGQRARRRVGVHSGESCGTAAIDVGEVFGGQSVRDAQRGAAGACEGRDHQRRDKKACAVDASPARRRTCLAEAPTARGAHVPGDFESHAQDVVERLSDLLEPDSARMQAVGSDPRIGHTAERLVDIDEHRAFRRDHRPDLIVGWHDGAWRARLGAAGALRRQRRDEHRQPAAARFADHRSQPADETRNRCRRVASGGAVVQIVGAFHDEDRARVVLVQSIPESHEFVGIPRPLPAEPFVEDDDRVGLRGVAGTQQRLQHRRVRSRRIGRDQEWEQPLGDAVAERQEPRHRNARRRRWRLRHGYGEAARVGALLRVRRSAQQARGADSETARRWPGNSHSSKAERRPSPSATYR